MLRFRRLKPYKHHILAAIVALILIIILVRYVHGEYNRGVIFKTVTLKFPKRDSVKTIAMGSPLFGDKIRVESNIITTPQGNVCQWVQDYRKSDAVLYHCTDLHYWTFAWNKRSDQSWVFFCQESMANVRYSPSKVNGLFNLTMNHMADSDVPVPYGASRPLTEKDRLKYKTPVKVNYARTKSKLAAARISQCRALATVGSDRASYLNMLKDYMDIDLYGTCFNWFSCGDECSNVAMGKSYKFYMAFENSMCKEYITEKFWHTALNFNMVPVVQGGLSKKDYEKLAPPHSFIHVDDFSGPKKLAEYLHFLDMNDDEYNKYFDWKKTHAVDKWMDAFPALCDKLHDESSEKPAITNFDEVFGPGLCRFPPSGHSWFTQFNYWGQTHRLW